METPYFKAKNTGFNLQKLGLVLWKGKFIIFLFTAATSVIGYSFIRYADKVYESNSSLRLDIGATSGLRLFDKGFNEGSSSDNISATEVEVLKSRELMQRVIKALELDVSYFNVGAIRNSEAYKSSPFIVKYDSATFPRYDEPIGIQFKDADSFEVLLNHNKPSKVSGKLGKAFLMEGSKVEIRKNPYLPMALTGSEYMFQVNTPRALAGDMLKRLKVTQSRTVSLLNLTYQDEVAPRTADVLNTLLRLYLQDEIKLKRKSSDQTIYFVDTLLQSLRLEMRDAEGQLLDFEKSKQITAYTAEKEFRVEQMGISEATVEEIDLKEMALNNLDEFFKSNLSELDDKRIQFAPATLGMAGEAVDVQLNALNEMLIRRYLLLDKNTRESPVILANTKIVREQINLIQSSIVTARANLRKKREYILGKSVGYRNKLSGYPAVERQFISFLKNYEIKEKLYYYLLEKKTEASITKAAIVSQTRVIDEAIAPNSGYPVSPKSNFVMVGSFFGGLLLGFVFVVTAELAKTKFTNREELEEISGVSVLAEIIQSDGLQQNGSIEVITEPRSPMTESFRVLRSNMQFLSSSKKKVKVISITSSISGEGKSFVSLNFAAILSLLKKRVVLVDLDLRKPNLHTLLGVQNKVGIAEYLLGEAALDDVIQPTGYHHLDVITGTVAAASPAEILSGDDMQDLLVKLSERYDYVVLDTSPIGLVSDSITVLTESDIVLYILRANYSQRKSAQLVDRLVSEQGLKNLHLVLNFVRPLDHSFGYGYSYGYKYGYYFTSKKRTLKQRLLAFLR